MKAKKLTDRLYNFLKGNKEWWSQAFGDLLEFTFQIRPYDLKPDVMIYTDRFPPGFPNGRLLTDDVAVVAYEVREEAWHQPQASLPPRRPAIPPMN